MSRNEWVNESVEGSFTEILEVQHYFPVKGSGLDERIEERSLYDMRSIQFSKVNKFIDSILESSKLLLDYDLQSAVSF